MPPARPECRRSGCRPGRGTASSLLVGAVESVAPREPVPRREARACASLMTRLSCRCGEVAERVSRSKPSVLEPRPPARAAGGRALWMLARGGTSPRATPGQCSRCRTTTHVGAWRRKITQDGLAGPRRGEAPATARCPPPSPRCHGRPGARRAGSVARSPPHRPPRPGSTAASSSWSSGTAGLAELVEVSSARCSPRSPRVLRSLAHLPAGVDAQLVDAALDKAEVPGPSRCRADRPLKPLIAGFYIVARSRCMTSLALAALFLAA